MRRFITLSTLTFLVLVSSAAGTGSGTISIRLRPDRAGKRSKLTISASGFTETTLPTSAEVRVQKGFKSSAKSVVKLCTDSSACPLGATSAPAAQVTATVPVFGAIPDTLNLTLYLGKRNHAGDIASVIVAGKDTT